MPRKQQGWVTFQSSDSEREILERYCQQTQRTKTEVLRELVRNLETGSVLLTQLFPNGQLGESANIDLENLIQRLEHQMMKVSARNVIKGTVKQVVIGAVNAEVTLEIMPGVEITSIITKASAERLQLDPGSEAYAIVKASDVMIAVD